MITKEVQRITSYSPGSISIYIKKLSEKDFIAPIKVGDKIVGYKIKSYKKVLKMLGVKIRFSGKNKNVAKEHRFKRILLVELKDNRLFKNYVELIDLYDNSTKQFFKRQQSLKRKIKYQREKQSSTERDNTLNQLKSELKSVLASKGERFNMSCKKFSRSLGYKSIQQGSLIERRGESNNFLNITRHFEVVESKVTFEEFKVMKACNQGTYWMFGNVVKNQCNELMFGENFFKHFESNKQNTSLYSKATL